MNTKNKTIVIVIENGVPESYASLAALCRLKKWSYSYLSSKKMPFIYRDVSVYRCEYKN